MAHFVEIDDNNIVIRITSIENSVIIDEFGEEQEQLGIDFCNQLFGGRWLQTSVNHRIRKQFGCIGYQYDPVADVFIEPKPYPSWVLNSNFDWKPPKQKPEGFYTWDESIVDWVEYEDSESI
jgi:hypothetical protein